jgi:hypothetical protein
MNTRLERLRDARTFFVAGTMQGSRRGEAMVDQGYRQRIRDAVLAHRPDAEVRDPGDLMVEWLLPEADAIRAEHAALAGRRRVVRDELPAPLVRLTDVFDRLVGVASDCDACIAWLPDHEASMGTAAEMWAAHHSGRFVVAITTMTQNLAVLACSDVIVPSVEDLSDLLRSARKEQVGAVSTR